MKFAQIAVAFDQLVNTLAGGYADETMSSRCWRLRAKQPYWALRHAIDTVLWFDKNHCEESFKNEQQRKYLPLELR